MPRMRNTVVIGVVVMAAHILGCGRTTAPDSTDVDSTTGDGTTDDNTTRDPASGPFERIHWSDFVYEGCFLLPSHFRLVKDRIAYLPETNELAMYKVRFGIPQPVDSRVVAALNTASWDGVETDPGFDALWNPVDRVAGMVWEPETRKLWVVGYEFYNVAARDNLGVCAVSPNWTGTMGAWRVADANGSFSFDGVNWQRFGHANQTSTYVTLIPKSARQAPVTSPTYPVPTTQMCIVAPSTVPGRHEF